MASDKALVATKQICYKANSCFVEMNFNKEMESSKTRKVYRRRKEKKRVLVNRHTQAGSERQRVMPSW